MDISAILDQLREEKARIESAIAALDGNRGIQSNGRRAGARKFKRRRLSLAAKRRISETAKARWKAAKKAGRNRL